METLMTYPGMSSNSTPFSLVMYKFLAPELLTPEPMLMPVDRIGIIIGYSSFAKARASRHFSRLPHNSVHTN